ncbi:MAG: bifunctional 4-hydroxy-3-methylbut-2-enyl diphosphate reductase/30S ribosomal protein S1, partial [Clostridia bacterium]|nr:bifunctional 4-hydroxy-3-methylbut-2-enyl diphosphate reductase/30S ribosomal protein S1 [Clostridia bacterium]
MKVTVASLAGFCFGVRRAVDFLESLLDKKEEGARVYTFGNLIHNPHVMEDFSRRGVIVANESQLDDIARSASSESAVHLVIRAHGIEKHLQDKLQAYEAENPFFHLHDMTCPFVAKIHKIAKEETAKNIPLFVFGDKDHPEVKGIVSCAVGGAYVLSSPEEAEITLQNSP